jgi:hypothetical protein
LVVFDEAHHLTAYQSGSKIRKTENYKLAEALKGHARDLHMLSATPHQGDHFRFWMIVQLLNPTLFKSPKDMVENRHRLNTVVFRRTKADSCRPDGSPLFARRFVHAESFLMSKAGREFYTELREYLEEGFALAKRQGSQGRALGFVMAIFQKIAASSFAAVRRTLRRRLLMLILHESVMRERDLDIDGRLALNEEAKEIIREEFNLGDDAVSRGEVERVMADLKVKMLRRLDENELALLSDTRARGRPSRRRPKTSPPRPSASPCPKSAFASSRCSRPSPQSARRKSRSCWARSARCDGRTPARRSSSSPPTWARSI